MRSRDSSWTATAMAAAGTIVAVAFAGRLAWELLSPLVGPLLAIAAVCALLLWFRRQRW